MKIFNRKKLLESPNLHVGDFVKLIAKPKYQGKIEDYLGYKITPPAKGRVYKIGWITPKKTYSNHYDFELDKLKKKLKLSTRPTAKKKK